MLIRQCAPEAIPFTLFPSGQHKWGYACSGQHVHNSRSESPTGYLQVHLNSSAVCQKHPARAKENFFLTETNAAENQVKQILKVQTKEWKPLPKSTTTQGKLDFLRDAHISPWTLSTCLEPACWWRSSMHWVMTTTERPCFLNRASHSAIARCAVLGFLFKASSRL